MIPVDPDQSRPVSGIAGKRSTSDLDKQEGCPCKKRVSSQRHQSTGNGNSTGTGTGNNNGKGKEAKAQDHGKDAKASGTKKLKRYKGVAIDINKVPQHDDSDLESHPATGGKRSAPHHDLSLENKKKELEIEAKRLKLEKQRVKWANESLRKDMELERMRLENDRMMVENNQLRVKIKRRALELGVRVDMI